MEKLDLQKQEDLKELIEYVLKPLNGKVITFLDPYKMTHRSKTGDEPWHEWVEILYPVIVKINEKEDHLSISDIHLNHTEDAIWRSCHDFVYSNSITEQERQLIINRLYSLDFLEFRKGKK
jgi:hypothetical protein